jgi:uncharacterized OsmC-like protein
MKRMDPQLAVEAHDPAHGRRTTITWADRSFTIEGDNQVAHGGTGEAPDGFDMIGAALGQCLLTTLLRRAQRDGVALTSAKAVVSTKVRLRGNDVAPYLSDFRVDIHLDGDLDEATCAELEEATRTLCGVRETLLRAANIEEHVHLGPGP